MKQNKSKHIILILIIMSMVFVSLLYMRDRDYAQNNQRIAVVYPKNSQLLIQNIQEGIQDYAYDHSIKLDVWYQDHMTHNELDTLVSEEYHNKATGILLVYPEKYMEKESYEYGNVLALTDTMKDSFTYSASFMKVNQETVRLPVDESLLKEIKQGNIDSIYLENTYKLGYKSMQMINKREDKKQLSNVQLKPDRINKKVLEDTNKASLFAN
ncbi:hypothetical protein [uncultured Catenibacterium sp.]|uniref:hypothetical protein n=1 Tax=uncultured Catenibacterium sp. TaxID=286142 RepID=UPI0025E0E98D|nr:hypothetical protein [uncultured Catenibacterium sp.]